MKRPGPDVARRYGIGLACWLLAAVAQWALEPVLADRTPFLLAWPATIVAAWYGGLGPAVMVVCLSAGAAGGFLFFRSPLPRNDLADAVSIALFVAGGTAVALVCEQLRAARRQAEERQRELHESETRMGAIVESALHAIIRMDAGGRITEFNPAAEKMFRYKRADVLGREMAELIIPPDLRERHRTSLARYLATGEAHILGRRLEIRAQRADGSTFPVELIVTQLPDEDPPVFVGFVSDITERALLTAERRRQRELLEKIVANAPVGVALLSVPDLHVLFANATYCKSLGLDESAVQGRPFEEALPPAILAAARPVVERAAAGERLSLREVPAALGPGREETWWNAEIIPLFDETGRVEAVLGLSNEVTDSVRQRQRIEELAAHAEERAREAESARDAAEAASRAKDEFLATVSHELRTPLTTIVAWAQLLRRGRIDAPTTTRALAVIERNAKSQARLIDDLLDVSRIIAGRMRLEVRPIDLVTVVQAALDAVRPAAEAKGVRLEKSVAQEPGLVAGDAERLQQVVWNLVSNGIKFTPAGGRVEVRLARKDSLIELAVSDTGEGIAPEFMPYLFDRFRQADASPRRAHGGLGLGLAITRHLVELHGGAIRAESPGVGRGTTFRVELPVMVTAGRDAERRRPPAPASHPLTEETRLDGVRILCVDDDPDTCDMLVALLADYGAEARGARSAEEALESFDAFRPDVLVSDIGMPSGDGYGLIEKIRARPREDGGRIPAVALTAYARTEDRLKSLAAGYQMHVPKPVEPAELVLVIASLVGRAAQPAPAGSGAGGGGRTGARPLL